MKFRLSFVTNSSDSSFIISKAKLTAQQADMIKDHIKVAQALNGRVDFDLQYCDEHDRWTITETPTDIEGFTYMDNFSMRDFLKCIGVKDEDVRWDDQETRYNEEGNWDENEDMKGTSWADLVKGLIDVQPLDESTEEKDENA